jgi:ATP-binding cassette subfamily C protein CydC
VPAETLRGDDVRRQIAAVPQDVHLFTATIAENLAIARPDASPAQMEGACRIAQIHDFIEAQPEGYGTFVGATGLKLSGGQIRRLAIARALLKDAPILILDEPTEGLDTVTERALMASVLTSCRDKAVLVISHRLAGLEMLDELVVLEDGRIIARGPPADVLPQWGALTNGVANFE